MHAVRVHEGAALVYEEVPDPEPKPGEAVVELKATGLNRRDLLVRSGIYPFPLPLVPGSDGAGIRRDTGEEVVIYCGLGWGDREDAPAPGFEVLGGPRDGTYAELVSLPEENLFPKPAALSWEEAAAFPLAALTAYRGLFARGQLQAGETVLVLGPAAGYRRSSCSSQSRLALASSSHRPRTTRSSARRSSEPKAGSTTRRRKTGRQRSPTSARSISFSIPWDPRGNSRSMPRGLEAESSCSAERVGPR